MSKAVAISLRPALFDALEYMQVSDKLERPPAAQMRWLVDRLAAFGMRKVVDADAVRKARAATAYKRPPRDVKLGTLKAATMGLQPRDRTRGVVLTLSDAQAAALDDLSRALDRKGNNSLACAALICRWIEETPLLSRIMAKTWDSTLQHRL